MHKLLLLGLNHSTAPLEVREKLAFNAESQKAALADFTAQFKDCEIVLLSTCNRVELYVAKRDAHWPDVEQVLEFVARVRNVSTSEITSHMYRKMDRQVVEHLFTVAASLDSMVLGETQILGQVREAYDIAREMNTAGPSLNPLFQKAVAVGKQVMSETSIGTGRLSVASVAVDYARQIFDHFDDKTVLNIGAGEMAQQVLKNFTDLKPGRLIVCNRDLQKALNLAAEFNGEPASLDNLDDHLIAADIVVTSTGSTQAIITRARFEKLLKARRYRPIFIIDIALPRDVEASVEQLQGVYLYNLDHLQQAVSSTQTQRKGAVDDAAKIVTAQVQEYFSWHRQRQMGPLIDNLYKRYHSLAQTELNRAMTKLPNISESEKSHLEDLARRIVNKLLHDPIRMLKHTDTHHGSNSAYVHAMEKLFGLEHADDATPVPENGSSPAPAPTSPTPSESSATSSEIKE